MIQNSSVRIRFAKLFVSAVGYLLAVLVVSAPVFAEDETYLMRYKLQKGEEIRSSVLHQAKTYTKINDTENSSHSRTISDKVWKITDVKSNGDMTFVYQLDEVKMSQRVGNEEMNEYDSEVDDTPPAVFKQVADSLGHPLSTVTINSRGKVVDRDEQLETPNLGMGDITIVFPEEPIAIGHSWSVPREFRARLDDGGTKVIRIRELYKLKKVKTGVATLDIRSEPLTPISTPPIEAQVVQQLSNGEIKFDIDAGRLISKKLEWDDSIVGFSGPGSLMEYSARYEETPRSEPTRTARK